MSTIGTTIFVGHTAGSLKPKLLAGLLLAVATWLDAYSRHLGWASGLRQWGHTTWPFHQQRQNWIQSVLNGDHHGEQSASEENTDLYRKMFICRRQGLSICATQARSTSAPRLPELICSATHHVIHPLLRSARLYRLQPELNRSPI